MKKLLSLMFPVLLFLIFTGGSVLAGPTVSLFINQTNYDYIYTANPEEYSALGSNPAFKGSGPVWVSPKVGEPVYRLYNPAIGVHHYTQDPNEVHVLCTQYGWYSDFNGAPAFYSGGPDEIYRFYDPGTGTHRYTIEYQQAYRWGQYLNYEGTPLRGYTFTMEKDLSGV